MSLESTWHEFRIWHRLVSYQWLTTTFFPDRISRLYPLLLICSLFHSKLSFRRNTNILHFLEGSSVQLWYHNLLKMNRHNKVTDLWCCTVAETSHTFRKLTQMASRFWFSNGHDVHILDRSNANTCIKAIWIYNSDSLLVFLKFFFSYFAILSFLRIFCFNLLTLIDAGWLQNTNGTISTLQLCNLQGIQLGGSIVNL